MADLSCRNFMDFRFLTTNANTKYYNLQLFVPSKHIYYSSSALVFKYYYNSRIINRRKRRRPLHLSNLISTPSSLIPSSSSSELDVVSIHEHSDGSVLFRFGDPSEIAKNVELEEPETLEEAIESGVGDEPETVNGAVESGVEDEPETVKGVVESEVEDEPDTIVDAIESEVIDEPETLVGAIASEVKDEPETSKGELASEMEDEPRTVVEAIESEVKDEPEYFKDEIESEEVDEPDTVVEATENVVKDEPDTSKGEVESEVEAEPETVVEATESVVVKDETDTSKGEVESEVEAEPETVVEATESVVVKDEPKTSKGEIKSEVEAEPETVVEAIESIVKDEPETVVEAIESVLKDEPETVIEAIESEVKDDLEAVKDEIESEVEDEPETVVEAMESEVKDKPESVKDDTESEVEDETETVKDEMIESEVKGETETSEGEIESEVRDEYSVVEVLGGDRESAVIVKNLDGEVKVSSSIELAADNTTSVVTNVSSEELLEESNEIVSKEIEVLEDSNETETKETASLEDSNETESKEIELLEDSTEIESVENESLETSNEIETISIPFTALEGTENEVGSVMQANEDSSLEHVTELDESTEIENSIVLIELPEKEIAEVSTLELISMNPNPVAADSEHQIEETELQKEFIEEVEAQSEEAKSLSEEIEAQKLQNVIIEDDSKNATDELIRMNDVITDDGNGSEVNGIVAEAVIESSQFGTEEDKDEVVEDGIGSDVIELMPVSTRSDAEPTLDEETGNDTVEASQENDGAESLTRHSETTQSSIPELEKSEDDYHMPSSESSDDAEASTYEVTEQESSEFTRYRQEVSMTNFVLSSGAAALPHPSKVLTGGEDAYFIVGQTWLGVADGVGEWSLEGTSPGIYARELMKNCERVVSDCTDNSINDPLELLKLSVADTHSPGSSAVLVAQLDDQALHVANIGDSGFIVLRHGTIYQRSSPTTHGFHFPLQIKKGEDPSHLAELYRVDLEEEDVIITATDGVFDNLYDQEISSIVLKSLAADTKLEEIAEILASKAQEIGRSASGRSPFADNAQAAGCAGYTGGKLDDVAVIVSVVRTKSDSQTM